MAEKKKYIDVEVPFIGSEVRALGTVKELENKTIKLDMSRRMRGKGLTVTFRIFAHEGKLFGLPNRLELVKSYIRRVIRNGTDYVEDSFVARCSDLDVRIKPFLITRKRVSRAVRKNLRNTAREFLLEALKGKTYTEACFDLQSGMLQRDLLPRLKKVYPLSFCDLRVFEAVQISKIDVAGALAYKERAVGGDALDQDGSDADLQADAEPATHKDHD